VVLLLWLWLSSLILVGAELDGTSSP